MCCFSGEGAEWHCSWSEECLTPTVFGALCCRWGVDPSPCCFCGVTNSQTEDNKSKNMNGLWFAFLFWWRTSARCLNQGDRGRLKPCREILGYYCVSLGRYSVIFAKQYDVIHVFRITSDFKLLAQFCPCMLVVRYLRRKLLQFMDWRLSWPDIFGITAYFLHNSFYQLNLINFPMNNFTI